MNDWTLISHIYTVPRDIQLYILVTDKQQIIICEGDKQLLQEKWYK